VRRFEKELLELQSPEQEGPALTGRAIGQPEHRRHFLRRSLSGRDGRRWRAAGRTLATLLLPAVLTGLLLGAVAWRRFPLEYEVNGRVTCQFAEAGGPADLHRIIRELQAPPVPEGGLAAASAWPFGELLSTGSVHFEVNPAESTLRIRLQTTEPGRARRLAEAWIEERRAVIGVSDAGERVDALLASLPQDGTTTPGDTQAYRQALAALRDTRARLLEQQQTRTDTLAQLADLRLRLPASGVVDPEERDEALGRDIGLQQDLRHLHARGEQVRRAVVEDLTSCLEAIGGMEPTADGLRLLLDDLQARQVDEQTASVLSQTRSFFEQFDGQQQELREVLAGSLEGLTEAWADEPQVFLDVLDRLDSTVRLWMDAGEEGLTGQLQLVDGLTEGQELSVRRVLIHDRLKRRLFALDTACRRLAGRLGTLRQDWNFQLEALTKSVRGLSKRVALQRRHIEERLQAEADDRARLARQAEITRLEGELQQVEQAERELLAGFLDTFEVMSSLEGAVAHEEVGRQRALWMSVLRRRLQEFSRRDLDQVVLKGGDFAVDPRPLNSRERTRFAATVGGGGAAACLLALLALQLVRRLFSIQWSRSAGPPRRTS